MPNLNKYISDLPANTSLDGTELVELQKGTGVGSSQKGVLSLIAAYVGAAIANLFATAAQGAKADSAVQSIQAGTGISVDATNPQSPKVTAQPTSLSLVAACSDETTPLSTGTKITFHNPYAVTFVITHVKASLTIPQATGAVLTVNINVGGSSILSTLITLDNTEKTSETATVIPVVSNPNIAADAEVTINITQIGDGTAKGLKVYLVGHL